MSQGTNLLACVVVVGLVRPDHDVDRAGVVIMGNGLTEEAGKAVMGLTDALKTANLPCSC